MADSPSPLKIATDTFAGLPDAIKSGGPVAVILAFVLVFVVFAGFEGWWVFGSSYKAMTTDRDEFKGIAFRCTGVVTGAAQKSAQINDQAVDEGKRTVLRATAPITANEKRAIEPPRSAESADLKEKIEASERVLQKTEATPTPKQPDKQ